LTGQLQSKGKKRGRQTATSRNTKSKTLITNVLLFKIAAISRLIYIGVFKAPKWRNSMRGAYERRFEVK
jgi:hypothetical protein